MSLLARQRCSPLGDRSVTALSVQRKKAMAAITATLAVSIKISGKSKPANARTFDMGTTLKYPDTEGKGPAKRG